MRSLLIGNLISAAASVFLALSCVLNDRRRAYWCQLLESALLVVSSVFFGAWVRLITQALAVGRNALVIKDKLTVPLTAAFTAATVIIGLLVNTEGWLGLIPIGATVQLTLCNYYCRSMRSTKIGFLVNVVLWAAYSFCLLDYAYGVANTAIALASLLSLYRLIRRERE